MNFKMEIPMEKADRRSFLRKSMLGLSSAALIPNLVKASTPGSLLPVIHDELPGRLLGETGITVPLISFGASGINSPSLIQNAYRRGIKLFFTATYYGEGNNEKILGEAIKIFPRDSFLVGTAVLPKGVDHKNGLFTHESDYDSFIKKADESLKRLQMDYVDILLLPFAAKRESVFFEPLLKAMQDLKKQGKARFIGIASHSYIDEAVRAAADTNVYDVAMIAYNFRQSNTEEMSNAIVYASNAGLGIIAMKTQAGAYWDKERKQPINSRAAIKWVLQNEHVSTIVSGMTKLEELEQNIALLNNYKITDDDLRDLKLANAVELPGLFCQHCGTCIKQCKKSLDIPTAMRSYMYAYGYRELAYARNTLEVSGINQCTCNDCDICTVECPLGFPVREKLQDIARLKQVPEDFLLA